MVLTSVFVDSVNLWSRRSNKQHLRFLRLLPIFQQLRLVKVSRFTVMLLILNSC